MICSGRQFLWAWCGSGARLRSGRACSGDGRYVVGIVRGAGRGFFRAGEGTARAGRAWSDEEQELDVGDQFGVRPGSVLAGGRVVAGAE